MSLLLILLSSGTLVTPTPLPSLDPPQYVDGVYNRSNDLWRIENSLSRWEHIRGVVPGGPKLARENEWVSSHLNADDHYLVAQKKLGVEAMISVADELHLKWETRAPSNYVAVLGRAISLLLDMSIKEPSATAKAAQYGGEILSRLPAAPLDPANLGAGYLLKNHALSPEQPAVVALDLLPRAEALNGVLAVMARVNDFMQSFSPEVELAKLPEEARRVVQAHATPEPQHGEFLPPADFALYLEFVEKLERHRRFSKASSDPLDHGRAIFQVKREQALAEYIQRRYTLRPADLKELELLLDRHIKDPVLKERLVLAAFKGINPLAGRSPLAATTTQGQDQPGATRTISAVQQGAEDQHPLKSSRASGANQVQMAADSGPLAAASIGSIANLVLWLTIAGASALILLVLWRAQARGASGGPK